MFQQLLGPVMDLAGEALERFGPAKKMDDSERAELKQAMAIAVMADQQKTLEVQMSAIVAEAKSNDPWTSRARPSFLYVIYIYILAAIPMGLVSAFDPQMALNIQAGISGFLAGIPGEMWATFSAGYLGYAGMRSYDKGKLLKR